jgi:hypothetical protein
MNMQTQSTNQNPQQRQGRIIFLLMTVFFAVPIAVVLVMYKLDWRPTGQSYGELVSPPRLIQQFETLKDSDGKTNPTLWADKWSMVYLTQKCEKNCMDKLHTMRQIHVSLYKDMMRAQRVLITTSNDVTEIKNQFPDLIIINQPKESILQFTQQFDVGGETAINSNRLYFVDPLGHIMISYPNAISAGDIRKDLVHLLKYSWAG